MTRAPSLSAHLEKLGPFPVTGDTGRARQVWTDYRRREGYVGYAPILTTPEAQLKLGKDGRLPLYGLTLAAASQSGRWNVCQWSTPKCELACVLHPRYESVHQAQVVRTLFIGDHPAEAVILIAEELRDAVRTRGPIGFRPNTGSDIRWERIAPELFELDGVSVYDYTKAPAEHRTPTDNYRLTYSVSERPVSDRHAVEYLERGGTVAVVFAVRKGHPLPETWNGYPVVDGDATDNRLLDPPGSVVGLRAKGKALGKGATISEGFVRPGIAS